MEGWQAPVWEVSEWIEPGSRYDLGERFIEIHYTPGHTTDSVSVYDAQNGILFSGDYLYPGPLWAFLPNSSMRDYLETAGPLLERLPADTIILGAHRESAPGLPSLAYQDLVDLQAALIRLRDGELSGAGTWPVTFEVNDRLQLVAEPRWLQDW
jgi:glyoxylase-like metal-dependent hydrolase (beta-lactamase superfamily II)